MGEVARWKWFQRKDEPVDMVRAATAYPDRAGAYGWNAPTQVLPQDRPLLTRGAEHRAQHAVRRSHR